MVKRISWISSIRIVAPLAAAILPWLLELEGLEPASRRMLSIFLLAVALWVTEAIPLFAASALVILLEAVLISDKSLLPLPPDYSAPSYAVYFHALADPILMLFLGGFFLAEGASRYKLDRNLTRVLIRPFGTSPSRILLGVLLSAGAFSMFMSNTATTATLMAVILPVTSRLSPTDPFRTALLLSIPIGANIGGLGTPIGTPPNAIVLGALNQIGFGFGFVEWMAMLIPFVILILLFAWILLVRLYPAESMEVRIDIEGEFDSSPSARLFYITFAGTVILWLTETLHGMNSSIVGFLPVVILLAFRVFDHKDLQSIPWHVLWLVAGGIALGRGMGDTGLDKWFVGLLDWSRFGPTALLGILSMGALLLGTIISHSATANLLVPIGISLAASGAVDAAPAQLGVAIAVGCSLAMALPISTPPNAIAYATGSVSTQDLIKTGGPIGLFAWLLYLLVAAPLWGWLGVGQ